MTRASALRDFVTAAIRAVALALLFGLAACGASTHAAPPPTAPPARALPPLPELVELLPSGAETLLVLRPNRLFSSPATHPVSEILLPDARSDAIERRTGVRVADLTELVVADYGEQGFIAVAAGVNRAPEVAVAIASGMNTIEASTDEPFVRRVGYLGTQRREVAALDATTLLFAGDSGPHVAALLERASLGQWPEGSASVLAQDGLTPLLDQLGDAPLRVFVPHHIDLPLDTGPGMLLSRQTGVGFAIVPAGADELQVRILVHGELPPGAHENFHQWVLSVAQSALGAIVGISEGLQTLRLETEARSALVTERLPTQGLVRGLSLLLADRVGEALDVVFSDAPPLRHPVPSAGEDAPKAR